MNETLRIDDNQKLRPPPVGGSVGTQEADGLQHTERSEGRDLSGHGPGYTSESSDLSQMRRNRDAHALAARRALPAMERLALVLQGRSGQPYHLREFLYSLYNGKPCPLVD